MKSLWRPKTLKHQKSILGEHQTHLTLNKKLLVFTFFFSYIYSIIDVAISLNSENQKEVGYVAIMVAVVFQFMRLILFLLHITRGFGTNPKRVFMMELVFIVVYGGGVLSTWNIQMTLDPSRAYVVGIEAGWTFLYVHTLFSQWPWKAIIYISASIFGVVKTVSSSDEFNMGPLQAAIQICLVLSSAFIEEHRRRQKLLHSLSLEKTGQTLRNILNSLPDNIAILNLQGDIRFYNEYFGISFQLTEDMSSAKLFSEIFQVKPRERHLNLKKLQERYNFVRPMPRRTTRTHNGKPVRRNTLVKSANNNNSPLMRYLTEEFEITKTAGDRILDPKETKGGIQVGRSMKRFSQLAPLKTLTEFFASIKYFKDLQEALEFFCLNVDIIRTYTEKERSFFIFDAKYNTNEGILKSFEIKISLSSFDSEDSFIIILRDTTHRDIIVTLEDKNDFKDSVLSSISHELRTPLNTNLNLLQLAIDAHSKSNKPPTHNPMTMIVNQENVNSTDSITVGPTPDLKETYLVPAHKSGKLLGYLINDIVDYSMLIARKFVANGKEKYLLKSLEKIRYLCEFQAREKNLEFHISISQDLNFKVGTDHRRLRQILINLVNNAIRFTNKGFVNLRIEPYNDNPDLIQFIVRDSGIGITHENLERMAELLDSGNFLNKLNKESSGVGMGLIISHLLAKELGPTALRMAGIKIDSKGGEGSKFSFIIENWVKGLDNGSKANDSGRLDSNRAAVLVRKPSMAIARMTGERTDLSIGNPKKEQPVDSAILGNEDEIDEEIAKMIKDDNFKLNVTENKLFKENSSPLFGSKNASRLLNVSDLPSSSVLNQRGRLESVSSPDYIVDTASPFFFQGQPLTQRTQRDELSRIMCTCPQILVVDDDMFNLFTMENLIGAMKYRIGKATNGEEAVEVVRKRHELKCSDQCTPFKLIFMDLSMPIMDGFQATSKLKYMMKNREIDKIPIVACTAFVDQENHEKCFEYGMDGKISKPVNKNKLRECLKKYSLVVNDDED